MTRGRLAVHAHFYQPDRRDPFSGLIPPEPTAAPAHDWTSRIDAECYRPNAEKGNFGRIGWNLGPALASWIREHDPDTHASIAAQDHGINGIAQAWHHTILPLASMRDRRTEIRWGLRDFLLRYGRPATGIWLPETAVDLPTLRIAAEEGVHYTILAPWQTGTDGNLDLRRPYRVDLGAGRSIVVVFYDRTLSTAVSFQPDTTVDADRFARELVAPRLAQPLTAGQPPLALIATDGELYGHHQRFRDLFLARLTAAPSTHPGSAASPATDERTATGRGGGRSGRGAASHGRPDFGFDVVTLGQVMAEALQPALPVMSIQERTSWSCHHGVARWAWECGDAADGRWKQPLRSAYERLAAGIDGITEARARSLGVDPWAARNDYVEVAAGFATAEELVDRILARATDDAPARAARVAGDRDAAPELRDLLAAQSSRLAMFASDAWFWDDPARTETLQSMRFAAHAARLVDATAGTDLEHALVDDLRAVHSPSERSDGARLYRHALAAVGQAAPR